MKKSPETPPREAHFRSAAEQGSVGRRAIGRRGFRAGLVATLPVLLAVGPFGLIFGIVATEAGLNLAQTMVMTALVIAGASQLATLQLLVDGAPVLFAVLAGAVVNTRLAMYSASVALYWQGTPLLTRIFAAFLLHDQSYALSIAHYTRRPETSLADRLGFYFGVGLLTSSVWTAMTFVGATLGGLLPKELDLSFIIPVAFISIVAPMLRGRANAVAAIVASAVAVLAVGLPYGLGLMVGAAVGIAAGLATEAAGARHDHGGSP